MFDIKPTDALIIVDPQNDFCTGGALAVPGGDEIMSDINHLSLDFRLAGALIVTTQDWHPYNHSSFASVHGLDPYDEIDMAYGKQVLWPDHCVQGTKGSDFHPDVEGAVIRSHMIIRKGYNQTIDSYSAFMENDYKTLTGLKGFLREKEITRVYLVGLAYDFCVGASAIDAVNAGFKAVVLKNLTRSIAMPMPAGFTGTTVDHIERMFVKAGVTVADAPLASELFK